MLPWSPRSVEGFTDKVARDSRACMDGIGENGVLISRALSIHMASDVQG